MTNLIIKFDTTFEDLKPGDFFDAGNETIYIKTGDHTAMIYNGISWVPTYYVDTNWFVIPLKATITIERGSKND